jgi:hypothetical protein
MPKTNNCQLKKLKEFMTCRVPSQFYPNQKSAAEEILTNFAADTRYVMLSAQMQSGKTGCAFYVMFDMLISEKIDKVFIMSGSSETALREQWREKYPIHLVNFCQERGIKDKKLVVQIGKKIQDGIVWRQDLLKKSDMFTDKYLIIWDESHFAVTENQILHKFYEKVGLLSGIQGDTSYLKTQNAYILSITATRCAEQARFVGANDGVEVDDWKMVVMNPGEKYRGVQEMKTKGLLLPSFAICEKNMNALRSLFEKYSDQKKYFIIRCMQPKEEFIVRIAEMMGIPILRYNMNTKKDTNVETLEEEPEQFTLFLIRDMLRMGKELPKEYVAAVYECAGMSRTNTTLQGLVGRTCGYYTEETEDVDIDVYIPGGPENDAVNQYIESVESGFKKGLVNTALVPNQVRDREWYPNVPMHIRASELTELFGLNVQTSEMRSKLSMVCGDLKTLFDEKYNKSEFMTPEQIVEINAALQQCIDGDEEYDHEDGDIMIEQTNKQSEKELPKMDNAIENQDPSVMGYNTDSWISKHIKIIKVTTNVGFEGTRFRQGDLVVHFNTQTKSKFECHSHPKCNGKSVFSTKNPSEIKSLGPDDDGVSKCTLDTGIKHDISLFKTSLTQHIRDYLDKSRVGTQANSINTGRVAFSKVVYKCKAYIEKIFRTIEKDFDGRIKICMNPAEDEEGCVRINRIYWTPVPKASTTKKTTPKKTTTKKTTTKKTTPTKTTTKKTTPKKMTYPEEEMEEIDAEREGNDVKVMLHKDSGKVFEKENFVEQIGKVEDGEIMFF